MSSENAKNRIQSAYHSSLKNTRISKHPISDLAYALRDIRIFGADAGNDFAETNLEIIIEEAIQVAERKGSSMAFALDGSGRAAIESVANKLRELTGLKTEAHHQTIKISWNDAP